MAWLWTLALVAAALGRRCCLGSAALLVCCSAAQWARAASSSSLTPHWFTHPWNSHWGRRPPKLLHYSSPTSAMRSALGHHFYWWLWAALNFLKKVVVPRKRRFKRDKFGLKWVDAAAKYTNPFELSFSHKIWMNCWLKLKEIPVLKCEGRQWSTFNMACLAYLTETANKKDKISPVVVNSGPD